MPRLNDRINYRRILQRNDALSALFQEQEAVILHETPGRIHELLSTVALQRQAAKQATKTTRAPEKLTPMGEPRGRYQDHYFRCWSCGVCTPKERTRDKHMKKNPSHVMRKVAWKQHEVPPWVRMTGNDESE